MTAHKDDTKDSKWIGDLFRNNSSLLAGADIGHLPTATMRLAIAVVAIIPILLVYPFFQKFFAKGITMGAVKG